MIRGAERQRSGFAENGRINPVHAPAEWAMYVQALRTAHLHTDVPIRLPLPLHLANSSPAISSGAWSLGG
ncbi:RNaseH domain-containing protein [Streptomyces sp. NPDC091215]|uniref:RNaseH domain-containing protein n=1 Tax=Streptomyces sp. NPDC091215 TaxID=3155192 RepID=UPI00343F6C22